MIWPLLFGFVAMRIVLAVLEGFTPHRVLPPNSNVVSIEGARVRRGVRRRMARRL